MLRINHILEQHIDVCTSVQIMRILLEFDVFSTKFGHSKELLSKILDLKLIFRTFVRVRNTDSEAQPLWLFTAGQEGAGSKPKLGPKMA